jgi:hypothetical protein
MEFPRLPSHHDAWQFLLSTQSQSSAKLVSFCVFFLLAVCELVEEGEVKRQLSSRFRGRMLAGNVQQSFKDVEKLEIDSRMNESFKWDLRGMDSSCEDERRLFGNVVNSANGCELLSCQWLRSCGRVSGGTLA